MSNFLVHWMEWSGIAADIANDMILGASSSNTDTSDLKMGAYVGTASDTLGQNDITKFWNPLTG